MLFNLLVILILPLKPRHPLILPVFYLSMVLVVHCLGYCFVLYKIFHVNFNHFESCLVGEVGQIRIQPLMTLHLAQHQQIIFNFLNCSCYLERILRIILIKLLMQHFQTKTVQKYVVSGGALVEVEAVCDVFFNSFFFSFTFTSLLLNLNLIFQSLLFLKLKTIPFLFPLL